MSEMWNSVAAGWEESALFVDQQLTLATEALLDAAGIGEGMRFTRRHHARWCDLAGG
jgi:hypothetical protein